MALMDKPLALKKVHSFVRRLKKQQGKINKLPRAITLNYNNVCNFKCNFCFSAEESNEHLHDCLSFEEIHRLADEADALGIWEIVLTGGELLVQPEKLFQLIASFQTRALPDGADHERISDDAGVSRAVEVGRDRLRWRQHFRDVSGRTQCFAWRRQGCA